MNNIKEYLEIWTEREAMDSASSLIEIYNNYYEGRSPRPNTLMLIIKNKINALESLKEALINDTHFMELIEGELDYYINKL